MGTMRAPFFLLPKIHRILLALLFCCLQAAAHDLPAQVANPLKQAGIPESRFGVVIWEAGKPEPLFVHQPQSAFNPASVMKLLTTYAGLDILGPAYVWKTAVYADGPLVQGRLSGNLYLKGYGDPSLTLERVWLLVRELRQRGLDAIDGDIAADASWFEPSSTDPGRFDGEARRTYNAPPSALLANFNSTTVRIRAENSQVKLSADPLPAGYSLENQVRVANGSCNEELRPGFDLVAGNGDKRLIISGSFSAACGEKRYPVNLGEPALTAAGIFVSLWKEAGGSVTGQIVQATTPASAVQLVQQESPPLAAIIRDINKWSNNVMTRQLLLTLGAERLGAPGTPEKGAAVVREWLHGKGLKFSELVLENGAGLSRVERISPLSMARLLQAAYQSPMFAELEASLPIAAVDGTMKARARGDGVAGHAHLKTGSLSGAKNLAGYVFDNQGRRWVVVNFINHSNAERAGAAQDALIEWVHQGMPQ
jgi:serine-type D-Ala-D-Ala carboxypeptidase/endopeptidase (penicillin-binding protein 4)